MTKAVYLFNLFLCGCVTSSLLGWLASLHPKALSSVSALIALLVVVWGACWVLDDTLTSRLNITPQDWQAILLSSLLALLLGLGVFLCS